MSFNYDIENSLDVLLLVSAFLCFLVFVFAFFFFFSTWRHPKSTVDLIWRQFLNSWVV